MGFLASEDGIRRILRGRYDKLLRREYDDSLWQSHKLSVVQVRFFYKKVLLPKSEVLLTLSRLQRQSFLTTFLSSTILEFIYFAREH